MLCSNQDRRLGFNLENEMRKASLFFAVAILLVCIGCGGASMPNAGPPPPPSGRVMKAGQWSFTMSSLSGQIESEVDVNFAVGSDGSVRTLACFSTSFVSLNGGDCAGTAKVTDGTFSGNVVVLGQGEYTFSGKLNDVGEMLIGSFNGPDAGTFIGNFFPSFSGTYKGTITGFGLSDQITVTVTQNDNFGLQVNGTDVGNGMVANLSLSPDAGVVTGSFVSGVGQISAPQLPLNSTFFVVAIANDPTEHTLDVFVTNTAGTQENGTLTKQ
jgi:hypothetical protein